MTYDVCLSFAGEQRDYVRAVHSALSDRGVRSFFAEERQVDLWGTDLTERFDRVFREQAAFCVAFVSKEWVDKAWPTHERRSALARALIQDGYLLPVRFDDTPVPGVAPTLAYLDARVTPPGELADMIVQKVGARRRRGYLPPYPNRLFAALEVEPGDETRRYWIRRQAASFLSSLAELTDLERRTVIAVLQYRCPCGLPEDVHVGMSRLQRVSQLTREEIEEVVPQLNATPGFVCSIEEVDLDDSDPWRVKLGWQDMSEGGPEGPGTDVAAAMITEAGNWVCDCCYDDALERLDFSRTSSLLDAGNTTCTADELIDCPPAFRVYVQAAIDAGWAIEITGDQIRLLPPGSRDYIVASLAFVDDPQIEAWEIDKLETHLADAGLVVREAKRVAS